MYKQNLHTHTVYCDGADGIEDMILAAIDGGFDSIGFSGHSYTPFDVRYCMTPEKTAEYVAECRRLCEKYRGKIDVYCGIEQDYYAPAPDHDYDYIIGSVHYVRVGDEYIPIDDDAQTLLDAADKYFDGDVYALAEEYYKTVADVVNKTKCDIVGHLDVITKFIERAELFDVGSERYFAAAKAAAEKLLKSPIIFEMNAGAVAGGYRRLPYPARDLLRLIADGEGKITFSSDCHNKNKISVGRDLMIEIAESVGFKEAYVLCGGGFVPTPLD